MDKENVFIYSGYYSVTIKKDIIEPFVEKWLYFEIIMLSEINQVIKLKWCMISLYDVKSPKYK